MKHGAVQIEFFKQKANRKCDEFVYNTFLMNPAQQVDFNSKCTGPLSFKTKQNELYNVNVCMFEEKTILYSQTIKSTKVAINNNWNKFHKHNTDISQKF